MIFQAFFSNSASQAPLLPVFRSCHISLLFSHLSSKSFTRTSPRPVL